MRKRYGRAGRSRRRKQNQILASVHGVNLSQELDYIQLRRWLKQRGFWDLYLLPAHFSDTGRGLMITKSLKAGNLIISLPVKCLLTTSTVLGSYMGEYIKRWKPQVSPLLALCAFLISERHFGNKSLWKPYIDVLPKTYTCPVYFPEGILNLFPGPLCKNAQEQRSTVQKLYISSQAFFLSLQSLFGERVKDIFTHDALRWAWCSINTRTVYMKHPQSEFLSREPDVYALAPYLDLLNHSPGVEVTAAFNETSQCYEIRTGRDCRRYEQVFISYGPHDNQRLLLEYGFIAGENPHSVVYIDQDVLQSCLLKEDKQTTQKLSFLMENNFLENLTFGLDGPSWRLLTTLKLLCLGPNEFSCWKKVLLGASVSSENEKMSLNLAERLCCYLMDDNNKAMQKISHRRCNKLDEFKDYLDLVESLRREERRILESSLETLKNLRSAIS